MTRSGEILGVFQHRPPGALHLAGGLGVSAAAQSVPQATTGLVHSFGGPLDDVERVQTQHGLWRTLRHRRMNPLRSIGRDVSQQLRPLGAQFVEELADHLGVAALPGPHQPSGVVIDHAGQVALPLAVGDLVDPDLP